jgi:hypothetical protein
MMTSPSDSWVTLDEVKTILGSDAPTTSGGDASLQANIDAAVELLYALSGRQFPGLVSAVVRPTSLPRLTPDFTFSKFMFTNGFASGWNSAWLWGRCIGGGHGGCCGQSHIGLGRTPIVSIEEILIDGNVLDPSEYHVDDAKWLVRNCGGWPTCQNLGCPTTDPCTFSVDFTWGQNPPQSGQRAAGLLAAELYKADTPGLTCALPQRVTSISRQGVSFAVLDSQTFLQKNLTGIYNIDTFIMAYNPSGSMRRPTVFSPDVPNVARRSTWP